MVSTSQTKSINAHVVLGSDFDDFTGDRGKSDIFARVTDAI